MGQVPFLDNIIGLFRMTLSLSRRNVQLDVLHSLLQDFPIITFNEGSRKSNTVGAPFLNPFFVGALFARFLVLLKRGRSRISEEKNDENFG